MSIILMEQMQVGLKQDRKDQNFKQEYVDKRSHIDAKLKEAIDEIKMNAQRLGLQSREGKWLREEYIKTLDGGSMGHLLPT